MSFWELLGTVRAAFRWPHFISPDLLQLSGPCAWRPARQPASTPSAMVKKLHQQHAAAVQGAWRGDEFQCTSCSILSRPFTFDVIYWICLSHRMLGYPDIPSIPWRAVWCNVSERDCQRVPVSSGACNWFEDEGKSGASEVSDSVSIPSSSQGPSHVLDV